MLLARKGSRKKVVEIQRRTVKAMRVSGTPDLAHFLECDGRKTRRSKRHQPQVFVPGATYRRNGKKEKKKLTYLTHGSGLPHIVFQVFQRRGILLEEFALWVTTATLGRIPVGAAQRRRGAVEHADAFGGHI
jgi:hypothetical protein